MRFDARFWQRAFIAFTTGLLLAFATRVAQQTHAEPLPTLSLPSFTP